MERMKLGISLPNTLAPDVDRRLMLDWARLADEAGFSSFGTIDKPNYDSWDPLGTLAAAAAVTERARLTTTILQLPNRNEVLVAKQAAVIDRLSEGRMVLGVGQGARKDDFEVFGAKFLGRARRFEAQVPRIREVWTAARAADEDRGVLGPEPVQEPGPPIWIGGASEPAVARAVRLGDGYVFGTRGPDWMAEHTPKIREDAAAQGKPDFTVAGIAYVGVGNDPAKALEEATHHVLRYYGRLWTAPEKLIHHGPPDAIAEAVEAYAAAGLDELILFAEIPRLDQVEQLAELVPAQQNVLR
jgi:alkanesulfonate monooxygenase SsuD/methylene tetrahydromethanopterin reductase-like flavin-dependent oxidoreductase (luciferase family)